MNEQPAGRSFRVLPSYYAAIRDLPDEERLRMYDALFGFGCGGIEPDGLSPLERAVFLLLRPTVESSVRYFDEQAKRAGLPRGGKRDARLPESSPASGEPMEDASFPDAAAAPDDGLADTKTAQNDGPVEAEADAADGPAGAVLAANACSAGGEPARNDGGKDAGVARQDAPAGGETEPQDRGRENNDRMLEREDAGRREAADECGRTDAPGFPHPTPEEAESFARGDGPAGAEPAAHGDGPEPGGAHESGRSAQASPLFPAR